MAPNGKIPDAWDDDWVAKADVSSGSSVNYDCRLCIAL